MLKTSTPQPKSTIIRGFAASAPPSLLLGNHATPIGIQRFKGLHRLLLHELLVPQAAEVPRSGRAVGGEERHPFLEVDPQGVTLQGVAVPVLPGGPGRCWGAGRILCFDARKLCFSSGISWGYHGEYIWHSYGSHGPCKIDDKNKMICQTKKCDSIAALNHQRAISLGCTKWMSLNIALIHFKQCGKQQNVISKDHFGMLVPLIWRCYLGWFIIGLTTLYNMFTGRNDDRLLGVRSQSTVLSGICFGRRNWGLTEIHSMYCLFLQKRKKQMGWDILGILGQ